MRRDRSSSSSLSVALLILAATTRPGLSTEAPQCDPSRHICGGRCPALPPDSHPPSGGWDGGGVCLRDEVTGACVCWLRNEDSSPSESPHLQTLFRCEVPLHNGGVRHVMCLPPAHCFPPDAEWGCMIVPHCPCAAHAPSQKISSQWHPVVAFLLRSRKPVQREVGAVPTSSPSSADEGGEEDKEKNPDGGESSSSSSREFSLRHLLFLVAFVVAPLLCWCTLTFFNGKRCRIGKMTGEGVASEEEERQQSQPLATDRCEEVRHPPSAPPKPTEAPPPPSYEAAVEDGRTTTVVVVVDCGAPPPPYEDAVREECHRWSTDQGTS